MLAHKERLSKRCHKVDRIKTKGKRSSRVIVPLHAGKRDCLFSWPIDRAHFWLSSFYGLRRRKKGSVDFHHGIDMAAMKGTSVVAAASGVVTEARRGARGYGNTVLIAHNGKYKTRYAHLKSIFVEVGQQIVRGGLIGTVGDTGSVRSAFGRDPSHLHFELHVFGKRVNPMHFLA
jgi:murein DD-endopeptidase MepM/ murein hydrolase activator NlpD